jgi:stage IV sporulation protein A
VPVCTVNCLDITEEQIGQALSQVLTRFPVKEITVQLPGWLTALPQEHAVRRRLFDALREAAGDVRCMGDVAVVGERLRGCEVAESVRLLGCDMGVGNTSLCITTGSELFYRILSENTGLSIADESDLMSVMGELASIKKKYAKIRHALDEVEATGYGIVMPESEELTLEEPEIIRQNGRYGVRLRAAAPSIHMLKANITTEVSPIVGSERQSEELVGYLLREFEEEPGRIWESNIFGTSLYGLVNEGLHNKLYRMPEDARMKLKETVERIINEGCSGLICIIV